MNSQDRNRIQIGEQPNMPHDTATELSVLATLIRYNETYQPISDLLSAELFYYDREKAIYRTVAGVLDDGQVTDTNALANWAASHDVGMQLKRLDFMEIAMTPSQDTLQQDVLRLADMSKRRQCWTLLQQAAAYAVDMTMDVSETVEGIMRNLNDLQQSDNTKGIAPFREAVDELRGIVEDNMKGRTAALKTDIFIFDDKSLLRPGTMTVIAAFTSVGKTALAMNIAANVAAKGEAVAYYSLEMGKAELAARVVADEARTPAAVIMNKKLAASQYADFKAAADRNENLPIYIDERSTITFDRTIRSIRRMAKTKGVKLAIIDYLQIYSQTGDNVEASLAQMARQAKNIAKEMDISVILLSQLNRSAAKPALSMLRGSGQIEESADNVVLIDRPDAHTPNSEPAKIQVAKLILAKGRGIGTSDEDVNFIPLYTKFKSKYHPNSEATEIDKNKDLPF